MVAVQVIVGGLLLGAIYALFSSGLTLIWGMMNFINFAHGEFVMLGMYAALMVVVWIGGGLILIPLQVATNTWFGGGGSGLTYILYGGIIVVIARFEPGGLFELWYRVVPERWRRAYAA